MAIFFIFFSIIILWTNKNVNVRVFLLVAFLLRFITVFLDEYNVISLPDGGGDSVAFESAAREFSRNDGLSVVFNLFETNSYLISKIISIFYTIFGESKMMAKSISVALGTASVYLVYHLCLMIWDLDSAKKAAWVATLFPTLILYSSLILREVYIVFFLLIALIGIKKFIIKNSFFSFLQIIISFYILMFFHGPVSIGIFIFLFYLFLSLIKKQLVTPYILKINLSSIFFIILSLVPLILFLTDNIKIHYLGDIKTLFNLYEYIPTINKFIQDDASYPSWLIINENSEFLAKAVIKILYFLYSPFVWDLKSIYHIFGLFDGILYFILTIYVIKNRHAIWSNPVTKIFVLLFITYLIVYGISIGNFGTGIRHRSKFVVILIVLAAPKIHKFIFSTKKKLYNK